MSFSYSGAASYYPTNHIPKENHIFPPNLKANSQQNKSLAFNSCRNSINHHYFGGPTNYQQMAGGVFPGSSYVGNNTLHISRERDNFSGVNGSMTGYCLGSSVGGRGHFSSNGVGGGCQLENPAETSAASSPEASEHFNTPCPTNEAFSGHSSDLPEDKPEITEQNLNGFSNLNNNHADQLMQEEDLQTSKFIARGRSASVNRSTSGGNFPSELPGRAPLGAGKLQPSSPEFSQYLRKIKSMSVGCYPGTRRSPTRNGITSHTSIYGNNAGMIGSSGNVGPLGKGHGRSYQSENVEPRDFFSSPSEDPNHMMGDAHMQAARSSNFEDSDGSNDVLADGEIVTGLGSSSGGCKSVSFSSATGSSGGTYLRRGASFKSTSTTPMEMKHYKMSAAVPEPYSSSAGYLSTSPLSGGGYELDYETIQKQRRELQLLITELKDRDRELNEMVASHRRQLEAWEMDRQRLLSLEARCTKYEGELTRKNEQIKQLTNQMKVCESQEEAKQCEIDALKLQIENITDEVNSNSSRLKESEEKNTQLSRSLRETSSSLSELESREQELVTVLSAKNAELENLNREIMLLNETNQSQASQLKDLEISEQNLRKENKEWREKALESSSEVSNLKPEIDELANKNSESEAKILELQSQVDLLHKELSLTNERERRKDQLIDLQRSKQERTEAELSSLRQITERQQKEISVLERSLHSAQDLLGEIELSAAVASASVSNGPSSQQKSLKDYNQNYGDEQLMDEQIIANCVSSRIIGSSATSSILGSGSSRGRKSVTFNQMKEDQNGSCD